MLVEKSMVENLKPAKKMSGPPNDETFFLLEAKFAVCWAEFEPVGLWFTTDFPTSIFKNDPTHDCSDKD